MKKNSKQAGFCFGDFELFREETAGESGNSAAEVDKGQVESAPEAPRFNENECGGVFDGFGVISDADPCL